MLMADMKKQTQLVQGNEAMGAKTSEGTSTNNTGIKDDPVTKFPSQTAKDGTPQNLAIAPAPVEKKLPNNELFSNGLNDESKEFIDSKIQLFKENLLRYGRKICSDLDIVNNENNEIYDYPIVLFQDLHDELQKNADSEYLYRCIQKAYPRVMLAEKVTEQVILPMQIILGIMLNVYLDKVGRKNYVSSLENIKNLSVATCYNYIKAAKMIDIIDDERIFAIGLVPLYELYSMYKKGKIDNEKRLSEALIDTFCNITASSITLSDDEFVLAIKYVIFAYNLSQMKINPELYSELFKARYEWKKRDLAFIKSHAYTKNAKNVIAISDDDFLNKYMKALINNNFNGRLARENLIISLPPGPIQNTVQRASTKEMGNPFTIKSSVSHLLETLDSLSNNSKPFSKEDKKDLKLLLDKLNNMNL